MGEFELRKNTDQFFRQSELITERIVKFENMLQNLAQKQAYEIGVASGDNHKETRPERCDPNFALTRPTTGCPKPFWKQKLSQWDFVPLTDITEQEKTEWKVTLRAEWLLRTDNCDLMAREFVKGKVIKVLQNEEGSNVFLVKCDTNVTKLVSEESFFNQWAFERHRDEETYWTDSDVDLLEECDNEQASVQSCDDGRNSDSDENPFEDSDSGQFYSHYGVLFDD